MIESAHLAGAYRKSDSRPPDAVEAIVIHRNTVALERRTDGSLRWPGANDAERTAAFHRGSPVAAERFRLFPYHYFVDADGSVHRIHDVGVTSPHKAGFNRTRVGVALCHDGRVAAPPEHVFAGAVEAVRDAWRRLGRRVPLEPHSEAKRCPGHHISTVKIERAAQALEAKDGS